MDPTTLSDGIRSSTALSLVSSVRYHTALPTTYVSGLDALLHSANLSLRRGDIVEVQGLPGSGKSSLLLHLAATALLPRTAHVRIADQVLAVPVGGKEQAVAWIDCAAARFDIDRLASLIRHHLDLAIRRFRAPRGIGAPRGEELESLVDECMARLHVFAPTSTLQLAATVQALPRWAARTTADELGYVLVDGMSEFAWADQHTAATAAGGAGQDKQPLRLLLHALAQLRATLAPLVFITQWVFRPHAVLPQRSQEGLPFYAHHYAPPHWPSILSPSPASSATPDPTAARSPLALLEGGPLPVPLALHITLHPPPLAPLRRGTPLAALLAEQRRRVRAREKALAGPRKGSVGTAEGAVGGTEGIKCVVRRPGGAEVGSWEMGVWEREIVT
ncbi:hypothetical protein JCM10450v2_003128 [Rhodotorula kratochvilovae]